MASQIRNFDSRRNKKRRNYCGKTDSERKSRDKKKIIK